jgi:hypothetical protein
MTETSLHIEAGDSLETCAGYRLRGGGITGLVSS